MGERRGDAIPIAGDYQFRARYSGPPMQRFWHEQKERILDRFFSVKCGEIVLDCGCGSGVVAAALARQAGKVVAVDSNPEAIAFAKGQFHLPNLELVESTVDEISFPPSTFDKIICLEVIEHLYEEQGLKLLSVLCRLLKPGGSFFVTTPNYRGLWPVVEWLADRSGKVAPMERHQHVCRYHRSKLSGVLDRAGFSVDAIGTFSTLAPFLAPVSYRLATRVFAIECRIDLPFGNLLFAVARRARSTAEMGSASDGVVSALR
jgi:2-polyprenyl-3-methyl-5-hydroxy-6-metoxy-1,4-benzoquinol methylase